jgi:hypothetical protein
VSTGKQATDAVAPLSLRRLKATVSRGGAL